MSTTINLSAIQDADILTFAKMLQEVAVDSVYEAIVLRHKVQAIEAILGEWKENADTKLYDRGFHDKAVIKDADGNQFAVIMVEQNEIKYNPTPEMIAALKAVEDAKDALKLVQAVTEHTKVSKGKGYYYKVSKP